MPKSTAEKLKIALENNDVKKFKEAKFTAADLLGFKPVEYNNALLYASRFCSLEIVQGIIETLRASQSQGKKFKEILESTDEFGRNAFCLAAISDNIPLLDYLRKQWKFDINFKDKNKRSVMWHAIDRGSKDTFHYLLLAKAYFQKEEENCIADKPEFKIYFNSPECLLKVVAAGRLAPLNYLLRTVENESIEAQKPFLEARDSKGRDALILAAAEQPFLVERLTRKLKFDLERLDNSNHSALWYLSQKGTVEAFAGLADKSKKIDPKQAKEIADSKKLAPTSPATRKAIGRALTFSPTGIDQEGRIPKTSDKLVERPYRSFSEERAIQLLRQAATQLYFAVYRHIKKENEEIARFNKSLKEAKDKIKKKDKKKVLTEVQMMSMNFNGNHNLFLAANGFEINANISKFITDSNFESMMTTAYSVSGASAEEGKIRSKRFSTKLKQRIFGDTLNLAASNLIADGEHAEAIGQVLRNGNIKILEITLDKTNQFSNDTVERVKAAIEDESGSMYLLKIKDCKNSKRHAEEFLTDIIDFAKKTQKPVYSIIAGKKRPCLGCSGRMQGVVDEHNKKSGLFFIHTTESQCENRAAANTTNLLLKKRSHESLSKDGLRKLHDHGSGSDSDCEIESDSETNRP